MSEIVDVWFICCVVTLCGKRCHIWRDRPTNQSVKVPGRIGCWISVAELEERYATQESRLVEVFSAKGGGGGI